MAMAAPWAVLRRLDRAVLFLSLPVHLARHGRIGFGEQIEIRQGAEIGRPSVLYATVAGEGDRIDSVEVGGSALIVAEGRFRVAPA